MTQPLKTAAVVYIAPQRLKAEQTLRDSSRSKVQAPVPNAATALAMAWQIKGK